MLERTRFRKDWQSAALFLVLVTLPTLWVALNPSTSLLAAIGTIAASAVIGLVGWWFLHREGVQVTATMRRPTAVGAVSGYVLLFVALWVYSKLMTRHATTPSTSDATS